MSVIVNNDSPIYIFGYGYVGVTAAKYVGREKYVVVMCELATIGERPGAFTDINGKELTQKRDTVSTVLAFDTKEQAETVYRSLVNDPQSEVEFYDIEYNDASQSEHNFQWKIVE